MAIFSDEDIVFEAYPAESIEVDAGFDGDDHILFEFG